MKSYIEKQWEKIIGIRRAKRIFVAATRQNVGKTTISLGLIHALAKKYENVGFIKPVGQRYKIVDEAKVDEDSVLINRIFHLTGQIEDMSPVAVEKGFTEHFLDGYMAGDSSIKIKNAFNRVAEGREVVVIEGTGHAGVGSVFDLSNAKVAGMLNSNVILVAPGGIGNPIDEIMLNKALFDKSGVKLAGVIINKVIDKKFNKVSRYVKMALDRFGIPLLGVVPYVESLSKPTLQDFREELDMHVLCGEEHLDRQIKKTLVGAMEVKEAEKYIEDKSLIITPANRKDFINLIVRLNAGWFKTRKKISGLILSGNIPPKRRIYNMLKKEGIPTLLSRYDTYDVASRVHDLTVKIKSRDQRKVKLAIKMVEKYVNMDAVTRTLNRG